MYPPQPLNHIVLLKYWNLTFLNQLWTHKDQMKVILNMLSIKLHFSANDGFNLRFFNGLRTIDSPWTFFKERKSFKFGTKCGWVILFKKNVKVCWKIEGTVCLWPWNAHICAPAPLYAPVEKRLSVQHDCFRLANHHTRWLRVLWGPCRGPSFVSKINCDSDCPQKGVFY